MEEFCLSLIPLHEGLGLRTYSPLRESLSLIIPSKYCRKVHTDKIFCFLPLSHPLCFCPSPSLSLLYFYIYIYIYSPPACHPSSDSNSISLSLPPCLCPTQFISVCLGILVSPFSLPSSSSSSSLLFLVFLLFKVLWTSWASHHSRARDWSAVLVLTACPQMLPGFSGIYVPLCPSFSQRFRVHSLDSARTKPKIKKCLSTF